MIKALEYMAHEKPIVAFDLTEHRFSARDAAVYVKPNDELAFARAIADLMDDPERRAAMGKSGRERVEAELGWDQSVPNLLRAYESLLGKGGDVVVVEPRRRPEQRAKSGESRERSELVAMKQ
jgi:glycosyltransferase involved in cell wall biosynthesis